ncbi:MAG: hypothetical protein ACI3VP_07170, partial [Oscillospiraceae bacterium]
KERSTVSRQPVALRSSASADFTQISNQHTSKSRKTAVFRDFLHNMLYLCLAGFARIWPVLTSLRMAGQGRKGVYHLHRSGHHGCNGVCRSESRDAPWIWSGSDAPDGFRQPLPKMLFWFFPSSHLYGKIAQKKNREGRRQA